MTYNTQKFNDKKISSSRFVMSAEDADETIRVSEDLINGADPRNVAPEFVPLVLSRLNIMRHQTMVNDGAPEQRLKNIEIAIQNLNDLSKENNVLSPSNKSRTISPKKKHRLQDEATKIPARSPKVPKRLVQEKCEISEKDRNFLNNAIDSLINGYEIDTVTKKGKSKLLTVIEERIDFNVSVNNFQDAKKLQTLFDKISKIDPVNDQKRNNQSFAATLISSNGSLLSTPNKSVGIGLSRIKSPQSDTVGMRRTRQKKINQAYANLLVEEDRLRKLAEVHKNEEYRLRQDEFNHKEKIDDEYNQKLLRLREEEEIIYEGLTFRPSATLIRIRKDKDAAAFSRDYDLAERLCKQEEALEIQERKEYSVAANRSIAQRKQKEAEQYRISVQKHNSYFEEAIRRTEERHKRDFAYQQKLVDGSRKFLAELCHEYGMEPDQLSAEIAVTEVRNVAGYAVDAVVCRSIETVANSASAYDIAESVVQNIVGNSLRNIALREEIEVIRDELRKEFEEKFRKECEEQIRKEYELKRASKHRSSRQYEKESESSRSSSHADSTGTLRSRNEDGDRARKKKKEQEVPPSELSSAPLD